SQRLLPPTSAVSPSQYFFLSFHMTSHALPVSYFFFFTDTATTEIYTLSLHDALPISSGVRTLARTRSHTSRLILPADISDVWDRSEEHTSELQSRFDLVCRLLLEKKKKIKEQQHATIVEQGDIARTRDPDHLKNDYVD